MINCQTADSRPPTEKERNLADSAPPQSRRALDICEEITEDAYKQNHIYRPEIDLTPTRRKSA